MNIHRRLSTADTNGALVRGAACKVRKIVGSNTNAAVRYLKLYDKATAPTPGTDTPKLTIALTGGTVGNVVVVDFDEGVSFNLGLGIGITTGAADNDTGAAAANEQIITIGFDDGL